MAKTTGIIQSREELLQKARAELPRFGGLSRTSVQQSPGEKFIVELNRETEVSRAPADASVASPQPASLHSAATMDVRRIPVGQLKPNPNNPRISYLPQIISEMGNDLKANGQSYPILVTPDNDNPGTYFIIDGETRWRGACFIGWSDVDCRIDKDIDARNPLEMYGTGYRLNERHNPMTDIDKGIGWYRMINNGIATPQEIAVISNLQESTITKLCTYGKLPARLIEFMSENHKKFPYTLAYQLYLLMQKTSEDHVLEVANEVVAKDLSLRDLESLVRRSGNTGDRKPTRTSHTRQIPLMSGTSAVGFIKTYDGGRVALDVKGLDEQSIDAVIDAVTSAFDALARRDQ